MDQRPDAYSDDIDEPLVRPVRLVRQGRGLPPPPLAAVVGALGLMLGLGLGFALAPNSQPAPTPFSAETAGATPTAVPEATGLAIAVVQHVPEQPLPALVPSGGLSLAQALAAFAADRTGIPLDDVVSARVVLLADVLSSSWAAPAGTQWVWAVTVAQCAGDRNAAQPSAGGVTAVPTQNDAAGVCSNEITKVIILDYHTGEHLPEFDPAP